MNEFNKMYYPYGVIVRRSIPVSWPNYIRYRAPMLVFFGSLWYLTREATRWGKSDLTSDSEQ